MAAWDVFLYNTFYSLSDRNPFDLVSVTGVGVAPVRRLTQRGPLQQGETDIGYRYDPRVVSLVIAFAAASRAAADGHRDTLARLFSPWLAEFGYLRCTRDDGAVRVLDVQTVGMVDMPVTDDDRVGVFQRIGVQMQAANPFWRTEDPTDIALVELGGGATVNVTTDVDYSGTAESYPLLTVFGPITDLKIENLDTGDALNFAGWSKPATDALSIDLAYGVKTLTQGSANRIDKLTEDSDLATWRLVPHPWADPVNQIRVTGSGATAATRVMLSFHPRYVSL